MSNTSKPDELPYELRTLLKKYSKILYTRDRERKLYGNSYVKLTRNDEFMKDLYELVQGQMTYPNATPPTNQPNPTYNQPPPSMTSQGYDIRYNDKWIDSIGPDKIKLWDTYIPMENEVQRIRERITEATDPLCIEGDKGLGKTLLSYTIAKEDGWAFMPIQCSEQTGERQLFGSPQINESGSFFWAGRVTTAFKALDIYDKVIVFFDDVGGLSHEQQMSILSLCDKRKTIEVNGEIMAVPDGKQLMTLMTTNPSSYSGVNTIIEPLRSRLIGEIWDYPKPEILKKLIDWTDIPEEAVQEPLLTLTSNIHEAMLKSNVSYVIATRELDQFVRVYRSSKSNGNTPAGCLDQAIRQVILFKYSDPQEREFVRVRAEEGFGVKVK